MKIVAEGVNTLRNENRAIVLVTHYQRLLEYIVPGPGARVVGCRIIKSGDRELAIELEEKGYDWIKQEGRAA